MRQALNEGERPHIDTAVFTHDVTQSFAIPSHWQVEYVNEYTTLFRSLREKGTIPPDVIATFKTIIAAGERNMSQANSDAKFVSQLAGMYELQYEYTHDPVALARAEGLIKQAIAFSPGRVFYYHILAQIYEFNGRNEQAIATLEEARALNDNLGQTYWALALMYSKLNRYDDSIAAIKAAVARRVHIDNPDSLREVIPIFEADNDYTALRYLYAMGITLEPNNVDYYAKLAGVYAVIGNTEQAIATAKKIIDIKPAAADQVRAFIEQVQNGTYQTSTSS